jgi:beta-lactam-binding protein with PASTA domain
LQNGETVAIVVSRGQQIVAIPDVRGLEAASAQTQLESLGFEVVVALETSATVAAGRVIRTEPGGEAPFGARVTLVVSQAPEMVVIPNLFGIEYDDAIEELEALGLNVGRLVPLSCLAARDIAPMLDCNRFEDEGVLRTSVAPGASVPVGTTVDIFYFDDDL